MSRSPSSPVDGEEEETVGLTRCPLNPTEICRVCRCEATADQPLFHPCRCSGSIKYVHEDCLKEWLSRSGKRHCELCKFQFSFTRVYRDDMPQSIPLSLLVRCALERVFHSFTFGLRILLASTVWLIALPYITVWSLRTLLWSGENVALGLSGAQLPLHIAELRANQSISSPVNATYIGPNGLWYALIDAAMYGVRRGNTSSTEARNATADDAMAMSAQAGTGSGIDERQLLLVISRFFADCFEGQIITCLVVVVFVAGFLLREWILQNTPPAELQMLGEAEAADGPLPPPLPPPPPPPLRHVGDRPADVLPARNNAARMQQRPAVAAGHRVGHAPTARGARSSTGKPHSSSRKHASHRSPYTVCGRYRPDVARRHRHAGAVGQPASAALEQVYAVVRSKPSDHAIDSDKPQQARVIAWSKSAGKHAPARLSHLTFEERGQPAITLAWPVRRARIVGKAWTTDIHWDIARRSPKRTVFARYCRQCGVHHLVATRYRLSLRRGWSIKLYPNAGTAVEHDVHPVQHRMADEEAVLDAHEPEATETEAEGEEAPYFDDGQADVPAMEDEPVPEGQAHGAEVVDAQQPAAPAMDAPNEAEMRAEEQVNDILPRFFRQDNNNNNLVDLAADVDANPPNPPMPVRNNGNNGNGNNVAMNQFGAEFDPQFNEMAGEEFDGVLEAMGIRGPIGLLFQNAALMTILVMLALACAAWMPYIVGKTFVLALTGCLPTR
ncbi:hypothetical protein SYNPS1DRAFT_29672 [Syncephalis pseudoplumigaleata]|uniref:RING-type E3 ubiquitin transferase n=1 Tax=Syncephalis pseudoplumigaleata TaxID=1712513 RepID=A0A4P9YWY9_9FUNG|nr:hypothetical protein SYNPS1DRAFT_29672 [Syncephalis pseudoplumigaleata]|eukprot:RKP24567.1 hypothetical protein SYNPS1DRAFT_29672 [Syncephalis pseudoplumigaleata]